MVNTVWPYISCHLIFYFSPPSSLCSGHTAFPCCSWDTPDMAPLQSFALTLSTAWDALLLDIWMAFFCIFYMVLLKYSLASGLSWQLYLKFHFPQMTHLIYPIHSPTLLFSTVLRGTWHSKYFVYFICWLCSPYLDWKSPAEGTLIYFVHYHIPSA